VTAPRPDSPTCGNAYPFWTGREFVRTCCAEHWWQPLPASAEPTPAGGVR
jgi:hypothetical protein